MSDAKLNKLPAGAGATVVLVFIYELLSQLFDEFMARIAPSKTVVVFKNISGSGAGNYLISETIKNTRWKHGSIATRVNQLTSYDNEVIIEAMDPASGQWVVVTPLAGTYIINVENTFPKWMEIAEILPPEFRIKVAVYDDGTLLDMSLHFHD